MQIRVRSAAKSVHERLPPFAENRASRPSRARAAASQQMGGCGTVPFHLQITILSRMLVQLPRLLRSVAVVEPLVSQVSSHAHFAAAAFGASASARLSRRLRATKS